MTTKYLIIYIRPDGATKTCERTREQWYDNARDDETRIRHRDGTVIQIGWVYDD